MLKIALLPHPEHAEHGVGSCSQIKLRHRKGAQRRAQKAQEVGRRPWRQRRGGSCYVIEKSR